MKQDKISTLLEQAGLNVGYLSFNTEKKPFDDVKVRRTDPRGERSDHEAVYRMRRCGPRHNPTNHVGL